MKRYDCLKLLAGAMAEDTIVVANVGPISREWNALRPSEANLLQVNLGQVGLGGPEPTCCRSTWGSAQPSGWASPSLCPTARSSCSTATATC